MKKSYLEVKGANRTAWYESETIANIADGAALLNRTIDAEPNPDILTLEKCAKDELRPITQEKYKEAVRKLASGEGHGLVAEIDLAGDHASFTYLGMPLEPPIKVSGMASRIAGIYAMSVDKTTGELDAWVFTNSLVEHCQWERFSSAAEYFDGQIQEPSADPGMTMA